jgi:conjugative transposon TraN protein
MKHLLIIFTSLLLAGVFTVQAQSKRQVYAEALITPYELSTGYYKTTILIFPAPISKDGVDRGSADIIAKPVAGVTNILKLKANKEYFETTNLTVITTDGRVYPFRVHFSNDPPDEPIDFRKQEDKEDAVARFENRSLNDEQLAEVAEKIAGERAFMHKRKTKSGNVKMKLEGIYTAGNVLFYRFSLKNRSRIDYDIDFSRFYIRDQKRAKRTAQQEKEIKPLGAYYEHGPTVSGKSRETLVVAFDKFTIADKKNFVMQLFEKSGDRHLTLKADGKDIVSARHLSTP